VAERENERIRFCGVDFVGGVVVAVVMVGGTGGDAKFTSTNFPLVPLSPEPGAENPTFLRRFALLSTAPKATFLLFDFAAGEVGSALTRGLLERSDPNLRPGERVV